MAEFIGEYPIAPLSRSVARALLDWRQWHECRESSMARMVFTASPREEKRPSSVWRRSLFWLRNES